MPRMTKTIKKIALPTVVLSALLLTGCASMGGDKQPKLSSEPLYALDTVAIQTSRNIQELTDIKTAQLHKASTDNQWRS